MSDQQLSQRLRQETAEAHERAENSTFMVDLMNGRLDISAFIALQEQALLFYSALETSLDALAGDPCVQYVADRRLDRAERIRLDLSELGGNTTPQALGATQEYIFELKRIACEKDSLAMVAHHYVRYLGDLSGGQVVAAKMKNLYDVQPESLTFYQFDSIGKIKPYKDSYRAALDRLQGLLSEEQQAEMVKAAGHAFILNQNVFVALGQLYHT